MVTTNQLKREVSSFFTGISESDEYKHLNPEVIRQGDTENLDTITDQIDKFLSEKIMNIFKNADYSLISLEQEESLDKMVYLLMGGINSQRKKAQVNKLLEYTIKKSEKKIKKWYEEAGDSYFKYSGIDKLLGIS